MCNSNTPVQQVVNRVLGVCKILEEAYLMEAKSTLTEASEAFLESNISFIQDNVDAGNL